jgi:hypothetical protein
MSRRDEEAAAYRAAPDPEAYLRDHSGLPGPRGNLELIDVASAATDRALLERWAELDPDAAPENTAAVFLVCVGTVGLGRMVGAGDRSLVPALERLANDPRWRVREAVAMALQAWGDVDVDGLLEEMERWASGTPLEGRAAMAALCEPRLLGSESTVAGTLAILDRLTLSVRDAPGAGSTAVRVLRQALGYGWSVAIAADTALGLPIFERWLADPNQDVRWIVRENLAKARLGRAAPDWVERARARLARRPAVREVRPLGPLES